MQRRVIHINNLLVKIMLRDGRKVTSVLILLPHCIQISHCDIRLTYDIRRCKKCGKCTIKDLISISDEAGLDIAVATGGTIARRIVKEKKPDVILAVACERDLSSGIADSYPIPVLGIENDRPHGPCINTTVNISSVKNALSFLGYAISETKDKKA